MEMSPHGDKTTCTYTQQTKTVPQKRGNTKFFSTLHITGKQEPSLQHPWLCLL